MTATAPEPRRGMPSVKLDEAEFRRRFLAQFPDPAFKALAADLDRVAGAAWDSYINSRKSPVTEKAGAGYADPNYDLAVDWIAAKTAVDQAQAEHEDPAQPPCILIINGSSRSEHTCPGEMSKSWRLLEIAREICGVDGSRSRCSTCRGWRASTAPASTHARPAFRPRRHSATGPVPATPTTRLGNRRI